MSKSVKRVISRFVTDAAYTLIAAGTGLSDDDVRKLREEAPKLAKQIQKAGNRKPFKGFSDEEKRLLLAYVVYLRQNLIMDSTTHPNDEDAAKILHGEVFSGTDKKTMKRLMEELVRQLQKAGVKFKDEN